MALYCLAGIQPPTYTLSIVLDASTNNQKLLNFEFYIGWRHPRITDEQHDNFVDAFIQAMTLGCLLVASSDAGKGLRD